MLPPEHHSPHEQHPHHHGPSHYPPERPFNTPENAMRSVATGKDCLALLVPGKVWYHRAPRGELDIKGALLLNELPVIVLHFNPVDGSLLPVGLHFFTEGGKEMLTQVESKLSGLVQNISVLDGAEFREPEFCWVVPVVHQGRIVAHLKVSSDGGNILPDKKAQDELYLFEHSTEWGK